MALNTLPLISFKPKYPHSLHILLLETALLHWQSLPEAVQKYASQVQALLPPDSPFVPELQSVKKKSEQAYLRAVLSCVSALQDLHKLLIKEFPHLSKDLSNLEHNTIGQSTHILEAIPRYLSLLGQEKADPTLEELKQLCQKLVSTSNSEAALELKSDANLIVNVLVLEDHPHWQRFVQEAAHSNTGYYSFQFGSRKERSKCLSVQVNVHPCENLQEAVDRLKKPVNPSKQSQSSIQQPLKANISHELWLAISDLSLPAEANGDALRDHGEQLAQQLREYGDNLPVMIMSSWPRFETVKQFQELGAPYINKRCPKQVASLPLRMRNYIVNLVFRQYVQEHFASRSLALSKIDFTGRGAELSILDAQGTFSLLVERHEGAYPVLAAICNHQYQCHKGTHEEIRRVRQHLIEKAQRQGRFLHKEDVIRQSGEQTYRIEAWERASTRSIAPKIRVLVVEDDPLYIPQFKELFDWAEILFFQTSYLELAYAILNCLNLSQPIQQHWQLKLDEETFILSFRNHALPAAYMGLILYKLAQQENLSQAEQIAKLETAEIHLMAAIMNDPDAHYLYYYRTLILSALYQHTRDESVKQELIADNHNIFNKLHPNYQQWLIVQSNEILEPAEKVKQMSLLISLCPIAVLWNNKGDILAHLKRDDEALEHYDKSLALDPDVAKTWNNKAMTLDHLKRYDEALEHYDKALALDPDYATAWSNKASTLHRLKRYDEALEHYDKSLALDPDFANAWNNKASTLDHLKRYDEALQHYDKALALDPDYANAWNNKASTLDHLKRYDEALEHYDKALALNPDHANAWNNKGETLEKFGRYEEAKQCYEQALKLESD